MTTFKKKTKEELVVAFRKAIDRKREWELQAQQEFAAMRMRQITV